MGGVVIMGIWCQPLPLNYRLLAASSCYSITETSKLKWTSGISRNVLIFVNMEALQGRFLRSAKISNRRHRERDWESHGKASQTPESVSNGTTVVSEWRKVRGFRRVILSCDLQFGSGHAIKASVLIQSFLSVSLCLAARRGRTEAEISNRIHRFSIKVH